MERLPEFRRYYNHTIHPELMRLERRRRRLLLLLFVSTLLIFAILILEFYLKIAVLSFFLIIPIGFYITYLLWRVQQFRQRFKPHIVNLILDFIDDGLNFGTLSYESKGYIDKKQFLASRIFATSAPYYQGEDYIKGKLGELDFEMCELSVKEMSRVRNRLNYVFKGVFLHATFKQSLRGTILILPREFKQYLSRSIRAFTQRETGGGRSVPSETLTRRFEKAFMTYATPDASVYSLLSEDMQHAIVDYKEEHDKEIYVSFVGPDIYIGVTEPKDILEPYIFRSNVHFDLVREFFEDIQLLTSIVQDVDHGGEDRDT